MDGFLQGRRASRRSRATRSATRSSSTSRPGPGRGLRRGRRPLPGPAPGAAARRVRGRRDAGRRLARRPVAARAGPDPRGHRPGSSCRSSWPAGTRPGRHRRRDGRHDRHVPPDRGRRPTTVAAAAGTFLALALVAVLAVVFDALAQFTELARLGGPRPSSRPRPRRARPGRAGPRGRHLRRARHPRRRDGDPGGDRPRAPRRRPAGGSAWSGGR